MPFYDFGCDCGETVTLRGTISDPPSAPQCPRCQKITYRDYSSVRVDVFRPYVEEHFDGNPREITSKRQRDALCQEFDCSYDSRRYSRRPKHKDSLTEIGFETWAKEMQKHGHFEKLARRAADSGRHGGGASPPGVPPGSAGSVPTGGGGGDVEAAQPDRRQR